ncbi:hypothetical protein BH18THE1_BH18THE1_15030 [soil metagenome]
MSQYHDSEEAQKVLEEHFWQKSWDQKELKSIEGKTQNIEIDNGASARTIQAYKDAFKEKGLVIEDESDFPRDSFFQLRNLKKFDARVDPSRRIIKKIGSMVRQPVNVIKNGKRVIKDALYFNGRYTGMIMPVFAYRVNSTKDGT